MKPVAVSQRIDIVPDRAERRDALDQRLGEWLSASGYLAVPVPNTLIISGLDPLRNNFTDLTAWLEAVRPAAVLLSGGNDLGEFKERDDTECALLDYAKAHELPTLGVCRGMQMMGAYAGAKLHAVTGHVRSRHVLRGEWTGDINSYHNFSLATCPDGYRVTARSEDGEIEAIRHQQLAWEGWMWHPEREAPFQPLDAFRIKELFGA